MTRLVLSRRRALAFGSAGLASLAVSGCDAIVRAPSVRDFLKIGEGLSLAAQRTLLSNASMAREFRPDQRSPVFKMNGSREVQSDEYRRLYDTGFADYRLIVDGLVATPLSLSLTQLKALAMRSQITRHDCVEGWSAIGKWSGVPLHLVLAGAGLMPEARYLIFHCFDTYGAGANARPYYESIDLFDAFHPQTILAYALNDEPLPEGHGAPLRLRVERQLGYKQAKFIKRIELAASLRSAYGGKGGYWEDVAGYEWYGGI